MILTITPNPALDLTWHVERLESGRSHRVDTSAGRAGGKGLNVARVLHAQGYETTALTTAGGPEGEAFAAELRASGIPHRLITVSLPTRRSIAIVDRSDGAATLLNERGGALSADESARLIGESLALARDAEVVAVCGSLPPAFGTDDVDALVRGLRATGAAVVVDTSGPGLIAAARAGASVLKPNRDELADATGTDDPLAGARMLTDAGARVVVVSLGEEGLAVVTAQHVVRARLAEVLRGNATGAGDAAVAAICTSIIEGALPPDAEITVEALEALARRAVAWSAAAVLMPLAGEISPVHRELETQVALTRSLEDRP